MNQEVKTLKKKPIRQITGPIAVLEHQKQQYKVQVGNTILIALDKQIKQDEKVIFDKVLIYDQGVGQPYLQNVKVHGKCIAEEVKGEKVVVFKYKSKKNYRVKTGFRARYHRILIEKITKET